MLNFDFLEKVLGIVSPPYFEKDFSRKIVLIQVSLSDSLGFLRYCQRCVLQLFINHVVTS